MLGSLDGSGWRREGWCVGYGGGQNGMVVCVEERRKLFNRSAIIAMEQVDNLAVRECVHRCFVI